ncbi:hypothetical protein ACD591_00560 [Rufibacter glacialis]|uniref:Outer membrane beta-barrel protein n=1 Tax=Rufibacter glacialis TaxID=1259555 RepID=A0A5M8QL73_9BACT|nr:hypothetical protein [Rufibacter glacialis]KAA6435403.1 hypothetical protein FOE74_05475 [Rufibacter glacialis]GGK63102.1 hypothetical protein GCM10011405_08950 [Rufibacter glacialis]
MRNKHLIFGLGLLLLSLANLEKAQAQEVGLGLRVGGYSAGISGKYFISESQAIEGILGTGFGRRGFQLTGLLEQHASAFDVQGLRWFYGAGGHIGVFRGRYYYKPTNKHYEESYHRTLATVGIDGIVGLEYQITEIPISLGVDFKPFIEANRDGLFLYGDGALTVRYTF